MAGEPEHLDLHVEEHGGSPVAGSLALAADSPAAALVRGRPGFALAVFSALRRVRAILSSRRERDVGGSTWTERQEAFYRRFSW